MLELETNEDVLYEEQRMAELEFIQDYFVQHVFKLRIKMSEIMCATNCKQGDLYIIEIKLKKKDATLRLEIPKKYYDEVNKVVAFRDIDKLTFENIDKEVNKK